MNDLKGYSIQHVAKPPVLTSLRDTYEVSYKGKSKVGKWILKHLTSFLLRRKYIEQAFKSSEGTIEYRTYEVSNPSLLDYIMKECHNIECILARRAQYVIVGAIGYTGLEQSCREMYVTLPPSQWRNPNTGQIRQIQGMHVVIVPWFEGVLVLPDLAGFMPSGAPLYSYPSCTPGFSIDWDKIIEDTLKEDYNRNMGRYPDGND